MSHPIPGHINVECELCPREASDSVDFETGNNAEMAVTIPLCNVHLEELEKTGYAFEEKYYKQIEEAAWERLRGMVQ